MNNKPGSWWLKSQTDVKWNVSGTSDWVGGFEMPQEAKDALEMLKKLHGDTPPDDLEWGYMKD